MAAPGNLYVRAQALGETEVLVVTGQIDVATLDAFAGAIGDAIARGPETIVVDLSKVEFFGSGGLRTLLEADGRVRAAGRRLVVVAGTGIARRVLDRTKAEQRLAIAG